MILNQYPKVRLGMYLTSIALTAVGIVVAVVNESLGAALLSAAGTLSIAANATAANNVSTAVEATTARVSARKTSSAVD